MRGKRTERKEREPQRSSSSAVWPQRGFSQYENIDSATLLPLRAVLGACDGAEGICVCVCVCVCRGSWISPWPVCQGARLIEHGHTNTSWQLERGPPCLPLSTNALYWACVCVCLWERESQKDRMMQKAWIRWGTNETSFEDTFSEENVSSVCLCKMLCHDSRLLWMVARVLLC